MTSNMSDRSADDRTYDVDPNQGESLRRRAFSIPNAAAYQHLRQSKVIGIFEADLAGNVIDANDTFLRMIRHAREDLPLRWDTMTPPEFRHLDEVKIKEVIETGSAMPWEKEYVRRDGSRASVLVGASLIDEAQERCVCFAVDVSKAQRAEAARRLSEQRYLMLYDNIPLMCLTLDPTGTILTINASGANHLGYRPDELIGQSVLTLIHPDDSDKAEHSLKVALADRGRVVRTELRKVCKDGNVLWAQETARALPEDGDQLLVLCEDITERKQKDEQLMQYQKKLKSLTVDTVLAEERERRRIASGLHDQVGHTLALTKMKISALRASRHPADTAKTIADICSSLDEAIGVTRTLTFDLSSPVLYEVGLKAALQTLGEQLEEQTKLRFHFECDRTPTSMAEETAIIIYRIVEELLFNVLKHAHAHNVRVGVHRIGDVSQVSVEDDGLGLTPSEIEGLPGANGGFGLFSIRARIEPLGGRFDIGMSDMGGVRTVLSVPTALNETSSRGSPTRWHRDKPVASYFRRRRADE